MIEGIDPALLKTLVAIVDTGSFATAADRIHRTRSAVSMQMRRLEEIVGTPLFEKEGRRAKLNASGEAFLAYARRLLFLQTEALSVLAKRKIEGAIKLGTPDDYADTLLPPILGRFALDYPNVEIEILCEPSEKLKKLVDTSKVDIALVTLHPSWIDALPLRPEPMRWVKASKLRLDKKDPVPIAVFNPGCTGRDVVLQAFWHANQDYRVAYSSANLSGLLAVVRSGLAVTALACCSIPSDLEVIDLGINLPPLQLGIIRNTAAAVPTNALAELITTSLTEAI